jgi:DNA polymerase bacteriophage-type
MPIYVDADFETAAAADLPLVGADVYAQHPTTEILLLRYEVDGVMHEWRPGWDGDDLHALVCDPDVIFVAHNAGFEQAIWRHIMVPDFGFPPIPVERWEDTMATCAWRAIPLALDKAASVLGLGESKDKEGRSLVLSMSKPLTQVAHMEEYPGPEWGTKVAWAKLFKPGMFPKRTPERMARISRYCAQDVQVEGPRGLRGRIGLVSQQSSQERQVWIYDQKINQRGVRIDLDFVRAAERVVEGATVELLREFRDLTGGLNPGQVAKVIAWAGEQGVVLDNLQKAYLDGLLGVSEEEGYVSLATEDDDLHEGGVSGGGVLGALPNAVRRVLQIRQMLGSASIKKLPRMRACVGEDGRARGLLQYHAASPGRWGGRLFQPQNFPRGTVKAKPEDAVAAIMTGDWRVVEKTMGAPAIECVISALRHALIADPGKVFLVGDFAGIEARIVLALAGQHDKTELMAAGHDVYLDMASVTHGKPVVKGMPERQDGKNAVLGCGFQCGPENFNIKFLGGEDLELAERTVAAYRKEWAPKVPNLWYGLGDAALTAVEGRPTEKYGVRYQLEDGWLTAKLPSGWQKLWYFNPQPEINRFGKPAWSYWTTSANKWGKKNAYGGLLTENTVQALARGLLCAAMDRLERNGMPVVLSVHDELICEVDEATADVHGFEQLMAEPTQWAKDLRIPIAVEAWQGTRYRK